MICEATRKKNVVMNMSFKKYLGFVLAVLVSSMTFAANGGLDSLRSSDLAELPPAESLKKIHESDTVMPREFVQQPPLVPHDVRGYEVNTDVNSCLRCHSWKNASSWGATRISVTHFYDRDGNQLADVAPGRYFCLQCHVTQADSDPIVESTFEPVDSLK